MKKKNILIIDDDPYICDIITKVIQKIPNAKPRSVGTGKGAIKIFKKGKYHVVICDMRLPDIHGLEVIDNIKKLYPPCQIIVITGDHDIELIRDALRRGACDYLTKPFDNSLLHHAVTSCLEKCELLVENDIYQRELEDIVKLRTKNLEIVNAELSNIIYKTVEALTKTVEVQDPYTAGHQEKVAMLAIEIAKEINLSAHQIENIRLAGSLHDIGKIYIPQAFLIKPTKLTDVEYLLIQDHSAKGYDILQDIPFHADIAKMVLQHHERMDGSGYPHKLKGEDILIEARILAVADTVEAMMVDRPYRKCPGIEEAIKVITIGRGTHYWAEAVDGCLAILDKCNYSLDQVIFNAQLGLIRTPNEHGDNTSSLLERKRINCWDYKRCSFKDVCPAYPDFGDRCAAIVNTVCKGKQQKDIIDKMKCCLVCEYYKSPYFDRRKAKDILEKK
ncbi:response regulator [Candidatus Pacearchaeota archaeon]|nr:response regulator [Candidatus Pacearchaeota archaeon]